MPALLQPATSRSVGGGCWLPFKPEPIRRIQALVWMGKRDGNGCHDDKNDVQVTTLPQQDKFGGWRHSEETDSWGFHSIMISGSE